MNSSMNKFLLYNMEIGIVQNHKTLGTVHEWQLHHYYPKKKLRYYFGKDHTTHTATYKGF